MIDLGQLMEERSADPPRAADVRYPQIRRRIAARNRRRAGLVAAAVAVVFAITGGYASLPRADLTTGPSMSAPDEMFPPFMQGNRLVHSATAPIADRLVILDWTPSTLDFAITYRCFDVPAPTLLRGQMMVNGKIFADTGCEGRMTLFYWDIASRADLGIRVGEPLTITFTIDRPPTPEKGIMAVAIYVPVPFNEYPFPTPPVPLGPLSSWRNCPPDQHLTSDPKDPLKPLTITTTWQGHLLIRYQTLSPGSLRIAVDGVELERMEWWAYDNPSGAKVWDTSSRVEFQSVPGWKWPAQGAPVTLTFTPEHFTGPWQVGMEHTKYPGYTGCA